MSILWSKFRTPALSFALSGVILGGAPVLTRAQQDLSDPDLGFLRARSRNSPVLFHAFDSVAQAANGSVVRLEVNGKEAALATIVDSQGLALSKASELKGGTLSAVLSSGRTVPAEVLATDDADDLALIKVHSSELKPIVWAEEPPVIGQWTVTPELNGQPEAIGIVSAASRAIGSAASPSNPPPKAVIGVQLDPDAAPARIDRIFPGLSAEHAGLQPGDVILKLNDTAVTNSQDLANRLGRCRVGQTVKLRVQREKKEWDVTLPMVPTTIPPRWNRMNRQERMNRLGSRISKRSGGFPRVIQHDTVLQAWQCGGPLLDLDGKAIGLNIARAGRVASYALPVAQVREAIAELQKSEMLPVSR